jgi:hypothetical protein
MQFHVLLPATCDVEMKLSNTAFEDGRVQAALRARSRAVQRER